MHSHLEPKRSGLIRISVCLLFISTFFLRHFVDVFDTAHQFKSSWKTPSWAWTEQWGSHYSVAAQAIKGLGLPTSWEAERKPQQIGAFCLLPLMHHSRYEMISCSHSARSSLWDRKEVQTELRGRPVRRSAGKTKQNKNSSSEWAGRSQSRNRALGFRGAPVPWQTKQRETQSGFHFCSTTHTRPSFLSFLLLCLRCCFDHTPSSSLFLAWDILYISTWMHALISHKHNLLVTALPKGCNSRN